MDVFEDQPTPVSADFYADLSIKVYLVIDQTPLLKERVDSHDGTNIASKISSARSDCKIFHRVQSVGIDHEVSIIFVHGLRLAAITVVEKFRQGLLLQVVYLMHVKPSTVAW